METQQLNEVLSCLDKTRRLIHYHDDLFAIYLLSNYIGNKPNCSINELRNSQFSRLLNKPIIKPITAKCGDGLLSQERLSNSYSTNYHSFVLSLSRWGTKSEYQWAQTSRPGTNLVLQLNFTGEHDQLMQELKIDCNTFKLCGHPICQQRNSLAWSRIDLDLESGEALIEEVQNDWLRIAKRQHRLACIASQNNRAYNYNRDLSDDSNQMLEYTGRVLQAYEKNWSEVMLFTTIRFIKEELGISKIYYHSISTAKVMKNLKYRFPPISLYTDLPRKFCFSRCSDTPIFLQQEKTLRRRLKKLQGQTWFKLEI